MEQFQVGDRVFYHDWLARREEGVIQCIAGSVMFILLDTFNGKVSTTSRLIDGKWQAFRIGEGEYRDEIFKVTEKT